MRQLRRFRPLCKIRGTQPSFNLASVCCQICCQGVCERHPHFSTFAAAENSSGYHQTQQRSSKSAGQTVTVNKSSCCKEAAIANHDTEEATTITQQQQKQQQPEQLSANVTEHPTITQQQERHPTIPQQQQQQQVHQQPESLSTNVTEYFKRMMTERSLESNQNQTELVKKLQTLQTGLIRGETSGVLHQRLRRGHEEIEEQIAQRQQVVVGGVIHKLANVWNQWISKPSSSHPPGANINMKKSASHQQPQQLLQLSETPYKEHSYNQEQLGLNSLYVWGGVGQGKTMLMDAFFASTQLEHKMRSHFHNFMLDVQQRIHQLHLSSNQPKPGRSHSLNTRLPSSSSDSSIVPSTTTTTSASTTTTAIDNNSSSKRLRTTTDSPVSDSIDSDDPLDFPLRVAYQIASKYRLLCLDEFQVVHIADAMVIKRLFEGLLHFGCVVVTTSNRPPSDLYLGGLNRKRFLPFIDLLEVSFEGTM